MKFRKMHGLGNDYIIINCMEGMPGDMRLLARRLSDRHFGIGGDGVICICPSQDAAFKMRMFNADGSEGSMCGNGIRCLAKYVFERGMTAETRFTVETPAGLRTVQLGIKNERVISVTVDMGAPAVGQIAKIYVLEKCFTGMDVSMGNPHFVILDSDISELDVPQLGRAVERHPRFEDGVNVEFVRVLCRRRLAMRVWERGSGETLACGTGACAAAAALHTLGRLERVVAVELPGGQLEVECRERDGHIFMTGTAETVFSGELDSEWF